MTSAFQVKEAARLSSATLHCEPHAGAVVQRLCAGDPLEPGKRLRRHWLSERDRDFVALDVGELVDPADADETALADDADARAGLLDLAQHMRGEEDGVPLIARLLHDGVELLLVEWIQPARRLGQDEDARPVHESLDEHDLALVPC